MKFDTAELEKMVAEEVGSKQVTSFVDQIEAENETLFATSERQVEAYYKGRTREELVKHFTGLMVQERMNMIELAGQVANAPVDMDPKELQLLSRQALDEANHFRMIKDVVEYLNRAPIDVAAAVEFDMANDKAIRGAKILTEYNCNTDGLAMALYQLISKGCSARNWAMMTTCVEDSFIANTYSKIARDKKFHSKMGRHKLSQICDTPKKQTRVVELARQMRLDLFEVNCKGTVELP